METYHIEITDTFGGEANYSWKREYLTKAKSARGAITKLARMDGAGWRKDWGDSDTTTRYNLKDACVCAFVMYLPESAVASFNGVKVI